MRRLLCGERTKGVRVGSARLVSSLAIASMAIALPGCEEERSESQARAASAQAPAAASPSPQPVASAQHPPPAEPPSTDEPVIRRPQDKIDLVLTPERRKAVEDAVPDVEDFVSAEELEEKLYQKDFKRGAKDKAVSMFDRLARGQWVLFTGNVTHPTQKGFKLPVRYTPRDPQDKVGLTSRWFLVQIGDIEGYDASQYEQGDLAAVLAKYRGRAKAEPAYDLVLLRHWPVRQED